MYWTLIDDYDLGDIFVREQVREVRTDQARSTGDQYAGYLHFAL